MAGSSSPERRQSRESLLPGHHRHDASAGTLDELSDEDSLSLNSTIIQSLCTDQTYNVKQLLPRQRRSVRDALSGTSPRFALQRCRKMRGVYAFQMTELVTQSVRIRAVPESSSFHTKGQDQITCSCGGAASSRGDTHDSQARQQRPCQHLIWLLDQIHSRTSPSQHGTALGEGPYRMQAQTMTRRGYAQEMGDPYEAIAGHHLHILAGDMLCELLEDPEPPLHARDPRSGVLSVSQRLAALLPHGSAAYMSEDDDEDENLDHYLRCKLQHSIRCKASSDTISRLSQRLDAVLFRYDERPQRPQVADTISAGDVEVVSTTWAASHLIKITRGVRQLICRQSTPLTLVDGVAAARLLMKVLDAAIARHEAMVMRNTSRLAEQDMSSPARDVLSLYDLLVDSGDQDFVLAEMVLLPQGFRGAVPQLEDLLAKIEMFGGPDTYVRRFRDFVAFLKRREGET